MRKPQIVLKSFQINLIQRLFSQCSIQFKITKFSNNTAKLYEKEIVFHTRELSNLLNEYKYILRS